MLTQREAEVESEIGYWFAKRQYAIIIANSENSIVNMIIESELNKSFLSCL